MTNKKKVEIIEIWETEGEEFKVATHLIVVLANGRPLFLSDNLYLKSRVMSEEELTSINN